MKTAKRIVFGIGLVAASAMVAWASGDWSSAKSAADDMKTKQQELRKLAPQTRDIVTAICEAEETRVATPASARQSASLVTSIPSTRIYATRETTHTDCSMT